MLTLLSSWVPKERGDLLSSIKAQFKELQKYRLTTIV